MGTTEMYDLPGYFAADLERLEKEDDEAKDDTGFRIVVDLQSSLAETGKNVALAILQLRGQQEVIANEEKRLSQMRRVLKNKEKWLTERLKEAMTAQDLKKLEADIVRVTRKKNPLKCTVLSADVLPDEFIETRVEKVVLKKKLVDHYKATGEVPEGTEFTQGETLLIK